MNWFGRHLNWTLLITAVGTYLPTMVGFAPVESPEPERSIVGSLIQLVNPSVSNETLGWFYMPIWLALMLPVEAWILGQKSRRLWHLLWGITPFGWIVILCLKNKGQVIGKVAENDSWQPQKLKEDSEEKEQEGEIIMQRSESKIVLLKDKEWSQIDGDACRVTDFTPLGSLVDAEGKVKAMDRTTPYAAITIECRKLGKNITGYITHKIDFRHLWAAFKERTVREDEEVIIVWTTKNYKRFIRSFGMPKLLVWVCPKGAFEIMTDNDYKPELTGTARWNAMKSIVEWKPEVME